MRRRSPTIPAERQSTVRESIYEILAGGPANQRDLSKLVGIPERDVAGHLAHLGRSLRSRGEKLIIDPPICLECGFEFSTRQRFTRPSRCPECHAGRISLPQFRIE